MLRAKWEMRGVCHRTRGSLIAVRYPTPGIFSYIKYGNEKYIYSDLVVGPFIPLDSF